jgi:hypothetical protein
MYITYLVSEAIKNLPPVDWSILTIELLFLIGLTLFAFAMVRDGIRWARRRWKGAS